MTTQGRIGVPLSARRQEPRNRRVADAESRIDIHNLRVGEIGGVWEPKPISQSWIACY